MANPTEDEMMSDLAAADAAGDTELAQHIAGRIKALRSPPAARPSGLETPAAAAAAQPPPPQPGFLKRAASFAWDTVKPGQYPHGAPAIPRNPGESDKDYLARQLHANMAWGGSQEGVGESMKMVGYTLPGATAAAKPNETLGGFAESAAVRSLGADRTAMRKAFKGNDEARHALGRFLLDEEGTKLRSPEAVRDAMGEIKAQEGPAIGQFTQQAGAQGATGDLAGVQGATLADPGVASLAKNTEHRALYNRVEAFLNDQLAGKTNQVSPEVLHDIRRQLDSLSRWDQATPAVLTDAWRTARGKVDDEIAAAMDKAGLGDAWAKANARYANASRAEDLARIGAERNTGNRLGRPSEKAAALLGAATAAAHNPVAGVVLPLSTIAMNRYGMPVAARSLDFASRHLGPRLPGAGADAAALAEMMRRRGLVVAPIPTPAEDAQR